jgi:hypothetical protein
MSAVKEIEKKFHGLQKGELYTTKKNQIFTFKERLT